ncbi:hypothetical protein LIPSTDRAFT_75591 [Lipomyces starkeyi NRRL Y-11557]|uniref:DUF659 domain-containing protein n=1 Tax=Lipomyces starkeyi NRRL Y-11557 TaxID=675824 RepID=A0A1E3PX04_LIPST|nr:hypothetical protein LIPSTDRAFT_75591 [Lipomyces starkeyi NRRL Y-11557]
MLGKELGKDFLVAVNKFHVYAHQFSWQVRYHPHCRPGLGDTDGRHRAVLVEGSIPRSSLQISSAIHRHQSLDHLRPAFEIPHRKEVATTMLNDSYDREVNGQMILKTQAESHMTLVTDSWTNIRGEAIVNYVLVTPNGEAMFHSADPTGAESHTGSCLSKRIIEVIDCRSRKDCCRRGRIG